MEGEGGGIIKPSLGKKINPSEKQNIHSQVMNPGYGGMEGGGWWEGEINGYFKLLGVEFEIFSNVIRFKFRVRKFGLLTWDDLLIIEIIFIKFY